MLQQQQQQQQTNKQTNKQIKQELNILHQQKLNAISCYLDSFVSQCVFVSLIIPTSAIKSYLKFKK
jgi:hypothetical protein